MQYGKQEVRAIIYSPFCEFEEMWLVGVVKGEKERVLTTGEIRKTYTKLVEIFKEKEIKIIDESNIEKLLEEYKEDKNLAEYFMKNNIGYDKNEVERLGLEINKKIYGEEK